MTDESVEDQLLASEQRVRSAFGGQGDLARDAHLAAARMGGTGAACGNGRDLSGPAASEARHPGGKDGAGELDLRRDLGRVGIDRQARAGPGDAVILVD